MQVNGPFLVHPPSSSLLERVPPLQHPALDDWLRYWLAEDLHHGDITSWATMPQSRHIRGICLAKQDLMVCGLPVFARVFSLLDPTIQITLHTEEGSWVYRGDHILALEGEIHNILAGERVALNLLQHLSGIATQAQQFALAIAGTRSRVVDTRKTLPGLRFLQRYAVRVGGCYNHRYDLSGGLLIKENHIRGAGSITQAVNAAKQRVPHLLRIEVEVTCFEELEEALAAGADVIMLDNMSPEQVAQAVQRVQGRVLLEASGGISLANVRAYAETGVDLISVGALTHSVKAADVSLLLDVDSR